MSTGSSHNLASELIRSFLTLEKIDVSIFRALPRHLWKPSLGRFVFGGQVVGQALVAASKTVGDDHHAHSLHCYFLRGGNPNKPILYHVDQTRDGQTYSSRSIKATQEGIPIFTMQASYKLNEKDPLQHQFTMPNVPGPEELVDSDDFLRTQINSGNIHERQRKLIMKYLEDRKIHVEKRPVNPDAYHLRNSAEPRRYVWFRATGTIGDNLKLHQCVVGFISDLALLSVSIQPAGREHRIGYMASLDHSMWFHNPFRADEWMLYEIESPQCVIYQDRKRLGLNVHATDKLICGRCHECMTCFVCGSGKALCLGRMWTRNGVLAVSVAQEGVVRSMVQDDNLDSKL